MTPIPTNGEDSVLLEEDNITCATAQARVEADKSHTLQNQNKGNNFDLEK